MPMSCGLFLLLRWVRVRFVLVVLVGVMMRVFFIRSPVGRPSESVRCDMNVRPMVPGMSVPDCCAFGRQSTRVYEQQVRRTEGLKYVCQSDADFANYWHGSVGARLIVTSESNS
jgi:hypothetical protein